MDSLGFQSGSMLGTSPWVTASKIMTCADCEGTGEEKSGACHCGAPMKGHSLYDNHSAVEMTRTCETCGGTGKIKGAEKQMTVWVKSMTSKIAGTWFDVRNYPFEGATERAVEEGPRGKTPEGLCGDRHNVFPRPCALPKDHTCRHGDLYGSEWIDDTHSGKIPEYYREAGLMTEQSRDEYYRKMREGQLQYQIQQNVPEAQLAVRNSVDYRYDILDIEFERCLAQIAHYGAEKYGEFNWHKSRLIGGRSPMNHIREHLALYLKRAPYERFNKHPSWHLAAVAFNAMMEFYWALREDAKPEANSSK